VCWASLRVQSQSAGWVVNTCLFLTVGQLSSVWLAPAAGFEERVGGGQERKVLFDLMAFH